MLWQNQKKKEIDTSTTIKYLKEEKPTVILAKVFQTSTSNLGPQEITHINFSMHQKINFSVVAYEPKFTYIPIPILFSTIIDDIDM